MDAKQLAGIQDDHPIDGTCLGLLPHGFPLSSLRSSPKLTHEPPPFGKHKVFSDVCVYSSWVQRVCEGCLFGCLLSPSLSCKAGL